jgi:hypothetical protein
MEISVGFSFAQSARELKMAVDSFGLTQSFQTIQSALDNATDTQVVALLNLVQLGSVLTPVQATVTGITSAGTTTPINITSGVAAAAGNLGGGTVVLTNAPVGGVYAGTTAIVGGTGNTLPPILSVIALSDQAGGYACIVTTPKNTSGTAMTAVSATATYPGTVLLSTDGKSLTFGNVQTGFVIDYIPRPGTAMSTNFSDFNQH